LSGVDDPSRPSDDGPLGPDPDIDLIDELGGPQGIADSSLPGLLFIAVYSITGGELQASAIGAVGLGAIISVIRVVRGEKLRFAIAGFVGVLIAGFIATRTGRAEDFFLPGLLLNAAYALGYAGSILIRWPLIGVLVGPLIGEGLKWRRDRQRIRLFSRGSWLWVGMFSARLVVQLPLYLSGSLLALGIARAAMGLPLFLLTLWLTYLTLKGGGLDLRKRKALKDDSPA
jgi:hypothetical protein